MKYVIVGTAGHIDHGKSALVMALTGTDPDRLKEEKLRGITIDLGFAHMELDGVKFGFIDVPGHEKFVKNMLAGVGGIDMVLLVVAADESIMPQTREHFDICKLLKIQTGLIAITKKDLVDSDLLELVEAEVRELVAGSFLADAPIIAVSSRTGEGIEDLKRELLRRAAQVSEKRPEGIFRLPIDRAFTIRGFGTVVTGTLLSGEIKKEQEIEILPPAIRTRARGLQVYGQQTERARAGQRTAVNLHGVVLEQLARGMVLAPPDTLSPSSMLDVRLSLLPSARPLRSLTRVRFHHGTSEIIARVALLGRRELAPSEECYAQLRLESPTVTLIGDPFIIRQFSPAITIGGGIVLDNLPEKHKLNDRHASDVLSRLEKVDDAEKVAIFVQESKLAGIDERLLTARLGLLRPQLEQVVSKLEAAGRIKAAARNPFHLIDSQAYQELCRATLAEIAEFHRREPLLRGMPREELRSRRFDKAPAELFRFVLEELERAGKIDVYEETVAIRGREISLSPEERRLRDEIEGALRRAGLEPPAPAELLERCAGPAELEKARRILYMLIKEKVLVKINEDLVLHSAALSEAKRKIKERFPSGSRFSVGDFKDLFGLSRKYAIPLLEFLDKEHFTRRAGNERIVL